AVCTCAMAHAAVSRSPQRFCWGCCSTATPRACSVRGGSRRRRTREASGLRDRGDAPPPDGHRFAGSPATPHFFVQHRAQRLVFVPYGGYDFCIRHNGSWLSVSKGRSLQGDSEASSQRLYCPLPRMPCILVQSTRHSSIGEDNSNINLEKLF